MRIRITFSKQGALRYTGHLDLHKLWERAARRAELPLAYSQGFHPQPKMNLAAALPLGFSSRCEVLDMRLEHEIPLDDLSQRLNDTLPSGIQVAEIEQVDERAPFPDGGKIPSRLTVRLPFSGPGGLGEPGRDSLTSTVRRERGRRARAAASAAPRAPARCRSS